jgi:hypothetical protein
MRHIATLALCAVLGGCATGGFDRLGNEAPALDVPAYKPNNELVYYANSRPQLITYCHDHNGYTSRDGLNCAIVPSIGDHWCVVMRVRGQDGDRPWLNSICNGWTPAKFQ